MSSRTVLHVLDDLRSSGAERMLVTAAPYFAAHGVTAEVLSTGTPDGSPFASTIEGANYPVTFIPFQRNARFVLTLFRFIRQGRFGVVHVHSERAGFWIAAAGRAARARVVRTIHNSFPFQGSLRRRRRLQRLTLRLSGVSFVAVSTSVAEVEAKIFGNPTAVVDNWADTGSFSWADSGTRSRARRSLELQPSTQVVVSVGNCGPAKNHVALLKAVAILANGHPDLLYLHVGRESGDDERKLAEQLGVTRHVRFLGDRSDIPALLAAADVFVMPSLKEGASIAALEALLVGTPIVVADSPGLRELAASFPCVGLAGHTPEELAASLSRCLNEPPAEESRFTASQLVAHRHGPAAGASRYAHIYARRRDAGIPAGRRKPA